MLASLCQMMEHDADAQTPQKTPAVTPTQNPQQNEYP